MKFIEVSLGRPLLLVENEASIEAVNTMYRDWYSIARNRFRDQSPEQRTFERAFDPEKVVDNEIKLIIPWKGKERPTPIEFCQAISAVWA